MAINSYEVDSSQGMNRIAQAADYIKNKADNDALLKHQEARQDQLISNQNTRQDQLRTEDLGNKRNERRFTMGANMASKMMSDKTLPPEQQKMGSDMMMKMLQDPNAQISDDMLVNMDPTAERMVKIPQAMKDAFKNFPQMQVDEMPQSAYDSLKKQLDFHMKNQELRLKNKGYESDLKTDQGRRALLRAQTAGANARANETNRKTERDSELTESQQRAKIIGQLREYGPKSLSKEELKLISPNDSGDLLKLAEEHRSNLSRMKMMDAGNTEGIATLQAKYDDTMAEVEKRAGIKKSSKHKKGNSEGFDDLENYLDGYAGE